jgi:hypothetical protein
MAERDDGTLRAVVWWELFPWLILVKCLRLAIRARMLVIGAVAALLMISGWAFLGVLFSGDPRVAQAMQAHGGNPWRALASLVPNQPELPVAADFLAPARFHAVLERSAGPMLGTWEELGRPFRGLFDFGLGEGPPPTAAKFTFYLLCGLWALAVWSLAGGAMTRVAAVQLAAEERIGWSEMVRFASRKWRAYFAAPLLPVIAVLASAMAMAALGRLFLWSNVGVLILAVLWPFLLVGALVMALLLLGAVFGWPLMFPTISAEGTDSFEALSHSYAYVFQRPLHYLFYVLVAMVLGLLGWILVSNFAAAVVGLTYWAVDIGASGQFQIGAGQVRYLFAGKVPTEQVGWFGEGLIRFWSDCVKILATGYLYSYFWSASTAMYFLLRYHVDATEMDEVYLENEDEPPGELPPIESDSEGAPVMTK